MLEKIATTSSFNIESFMADAAELISGIFFDYVNWSDSLLLALENVAQIWKWRIDMMVKGNKFSSVEVLF